MLRAAVAGRAIGQSRLRFGVGDEFGQRLRRDRRIDDQRERHAGHQRDRRKILHRIVGQFLVQRLVDGERGRGRHQQRIAIGLGPCDLLRAERGAGARLVLDDDRRAKTALELIGDQPAEKVGGAARRIGHDHLDGSARIGRLGKAGRPASKASPPPHPAIASRRVNSMAFSRDSCLFFSALNTIAASQSVAVIRC